MTAFFNLFSKVMISNQLSPVLSFSAVMMLLTYLSVINKSQSEVTCFPVQVTINSWI